VDRTIRALDQSRLGPILTGDPEALHGGPPVTAMLVQNTNPAMVCPELHLVHQGLAREDLFLCVHEQFLTETAAYADIVLPATMFLEHDDFYTASGHTYFQVARKVVEPPGECRENHFVISELARRLGAEHPGLGMTAWEIMDETLRRSGMWDARTNVERGGQDMALPFEEAHFLRGFKWPDGKFRFKPEWEAFGGRGEKMPRLPDHFDVIDRATAEKPFRLVAAPARTFLNSTFTETPGSLARERRPTALMNPDDCAALGIGEGDRVTLGNEAGGGGPRPVRRGSAAWSSSRDLAQQAFGGGIGINALTSAGPGYRTAAPSFTTRCGSGRRNEESKGRSDALRDARAGAIGGVVGGQLAKAGFDVLSMDPLEEHVAAINRNGLQLRGVHGHHSLRVPAVTSVDAVSFKDDDVVVCSVKSYQTDEAMQALRRATPRELPIFCAQNGVRNEEMAARYFRAVHGVMSHDRRQASDSRRGRPHGRRAARRRDLAGGPFGNRARRGPGHREDRHPRLHDRRDRRPQVEQDGGESQQRDVRSHWPVGPGGAGGSGGASLAGRRLRRGRPRPARGRHPLRRAPGSRLGREAHQRPPRARDGDRRAGQEEPRHRPSLWQDLYHGGGQVEADWFNGEIVRLGKAHGVATPYSGLLLALITEMARLRQPPGRYTVRELRARVAR
jgi:ketopantoate reductase